MMLSLTILKSVEVISERLGIEVLQSGVYIPEDISDVDEFLNINPNQASEEVDYRIWAIQVGVWGIIVPLVKVLLYSL